MQALPTPVTRKRWVIRIALVAGAAMMLVLVGGWWALQHVPTWYDPPQLTPSDSRRIRASLSAALQEFTDRLVGGGTFEFKLSARTVNEWIAARGSIWPDARNIVPDELLDPVVAFENDRIIVAARFGRDGWQTVGSVHCRLDVKDDDLVLWVVKTAMGALRTPVAPMLRALERFLGQLLDESNDTPADLRNLLKAVRQQGVSKMLSEGMTLENRFIWPNGQRSFRIKNVQADHGWLVLTVEAR